MSKTIFALMLLLALNAGASVTACVYHIAGADPELTKLLAKGFLVVAVLCALAVGIIGERRESWRSTWNS